MAQRSTNSHHLIQERLLERIHSGEWKPGSLIPTEAALAEEFRCARTTVNRALRQLATDGLVVRKRRSGTRVALTPVRRATLEIPIIRHEVEKRGGAYSHHLLTCARKAPPLWVRVRFGINSDRSMLHLQTLHLSDRHPYMFEDRWVDLEAVPDITQAPLREISPNEWLVREVPYSRGEISFSVCMADPRGGRGAGNEPWRFDLPCRTLHLDARGADHDAQDVLSGRLSADDGALAVCVTPGFWHCRRDGGGCGGPPTR